MFMSDKKIIGILDTIIRELLNIREENERILRNIKIEFLQNYIEGKKIEISK
jgi:hypothetical protein